MHVLIHKLQTVPRASCAQLVVPLGTSNCVRRSQAAALGEDHEATLRTRMGLVNVLAETGRAEMAEDICRRVEGVGCTPAERSAPRVLINPVKLLLLAHLHLNRRAWDARAGADAAARGGAPRHAAVAAEPRLPAGRQG